MNPTDPQRAAAFSEVQRIVAGHSSEGQEILTSLRRVANGDAMRWLVDFADARKGIPMKEALAAEILDAYAGQGNAIRKRDEVHKMAQANKAFAHFRW